MTVFRVAVKDGKHYTVVKRDWADLFQYLANEFENGNRDELMNEDRLKVKAIGEVWNADEWERK